MNIESPTLKQNKVFKDNRGKFAPLSLDPQNQFDKKWIQSNISTNPKKYTIRGLHFQVGDKSQAKLIKVIDGRILDVVVDIREELDTFMTLEMFDMSPGDELFVPRGFAHGFITMVDNTIVQYLVDNEYSPESEGIIVWDTFEEIRNKLIEISDRDFIHSEMTIADKDLVTKNFNIKKI
jgi:dTDP-4-dehydrorhamnose 3,5-epimerase